MKLEEFRIILHEVLDQVVNLKISAIDAEEKLISILSHELD